MQHTFTKQLPRQARLGRSTEWTEAKESQNKKAQIKVNVYQAAWATTTVTINYMKATTDSINLTVTSATLRPYQMVHN